jgi:thiamine-monophosphate kinase
MKLSDIGERKAIKIISSLITKSNIAVGIGDDCAALDFGKNFLLVSTDMVSKNTHLPEIMTPWQIGWFSTAINLSDIAAKGGKPLGVVLSLGLPKTLDETVLKELIKGADSCVRKYQTAIVGGDTKENPTITISGTAFGIVPKDQFMARKGARAGDIVAVTGSLGKAAAGYYAIINNIKNKRKLSKGLMEPQPRVKEGITLAKTKAATSCMDISDGLASSLYQLQEVNNVGFEIDLSKMPVANELKQLKKQCPDINETELVLYFGGDYELLLVIRPQMFEKAKNAVEKTGGMLTPIGKVTDTKKNYVIYNKCKKTLKNKGYEHFVDHKDLFN